MPGAAFTRITVLALAASAALAGCSVFDGAIGGHNPAPDAVVGLRGDLRPADGGVERHDKTTGGWYAAEPCREGNGDWCLSAAGREARERDLLEIRVLPGGPPLRPVDLTRALAAGGAGQAISTSQGRAR